MVIVLILVKKLLMFEKHDLDQAPLYVATKLASIRKASFFCPSPGGYARSGVRWIGYEPVCTPYWPHSILWKVISELPTSVFDSIRLKLCLAIRAKGKAKEARMKQQ
jgi:17beta-estradiol 17-dehydrogenase / very-long-chain 3-oxoacyl-CoA reductase